MIVVADTSPLNYLIQLRLDSLLHEIYGSVLVPTGVLEEMKRREAPLDVQQWAEHLPSWVDVRTVSELVTMRRISLGLGEREAISLAVSVGADLILVDDKDARLEAEEKQLVAAGTLIVLIEGALRGRYVLQSELQNLKHLGFRITSKLEAAAIDLLRIATRQKRIVDPESRDSTAHLYSYLCRSRRPRKPRTRPQPRPHSPPPWARSVLPPTRPTKSAAPSRTSSATT